MNYVISTYSGKKGSVCRDKLTNIYPHPEQYLRLHLKQLLNIQHSLAQITISKPKTSEVTWTNYYDIADLTCKFKCPVVILDCPNYGLSYGQFLNAFEVYPKFESYVFMEDDYCPAIDMFDSKLLSVFKEKFPNGIGYLCAYYKNGHAANSLGLISQSALSLVFQKYTHPKLQFKNLVHGQIQVQFSKLLANCGVNIEDFSKEFHTPYYKGVHKKLLNCSQTKPINDIALFIPMQMLQDYSVAVINKLPILKLN